jgi:hypothetical protein
MLRNETMKNTMMKWTSKYNNGIKSDARQKKRKLWLKNITMKNTIIKSILKNTNNKTKVEARHKKWAKSQNSEKKNDEINVKIQ